MQKSKVIVYVPLSLILSASCTVFAFGETLAFSECYIHLLMAPEHLQKAWAYCQCLTLHSAFLGSGFWSRFKGSVLIYLLVVLRIEPRA